MPSSLFLHQQHLWAALHDPQGWSVDGRARVLQHPCGVELRVQTEEVDQTQDRFLHKILHHVEGPDRIDTPIVHLYLRHPALTLPVWQEVLAPIQRNDAPTVAALLRSLVLRYRPDAQGRWEARHERDGQKLRLFPQCRDQPPFLLPLPAWMLAPAVTLPQWLTAQMYAGHVDLTHTLKFAFQMPVSGHQRLLERHQVMDMPDLSDPAFATYWGLG